MPAGEPGKTTALSRQNLLRLWLIRSILLMVLIVALTWLQDFTDHELAWTPLWALVLGLGVLNAALLYRLWLPGPVTAGEFFANLLLDITFLTAVLYFSGGPSNPLASFYLVPVIVSAAVLGVRHAVVVAVAAVACYTLLFNWHQPFTLFDMMGRESMNAHMIGLWVNFVFSAVLIAWFVARMAQSLREQHEAMLRVREESARDEALVGVAGIAAGAAHELRTPLATMTVLTGELRDEHPALADDLSLMQQQLDRCDAILGELVTSTGQGEGPQRGTLAGLVDELVEKWQIARPEIGLHTQVGAGAEHIAIAYDQGLHHALMNLLHNAADASPEQVSLEARADGDVALIVVQDRGEGIPGDIAEALGRRFVSRKDGGLGLGVLISSASIERLDGQLTLLDREGGGTRWEVRLPRVDRK